MTTKYIFSPLNHNNLDVIRHCLHSSKTVNQLKNTHTLILKNLTKTQHHLLTQFLIKLLRFRGNNLRYARHVFDQIPHCKDQFLWTSLIHSHVHNAEFSQSIFIYAEMQCAGVLPSGFTFSSVLNACARIPGIIEGKQIHTRIVQLGFLGNKFVQTALLDMYAKCGCVVEARDVFDVMDDKDVVACAAMICGYTKLEMMDDARGLFDNMGKHNVVSWTTMVAGYANCGDMKAAKELYDRMPEKNCVTWVAMIAGYGKCGEVVEARKVFDEIVERDASCWAAMVACFAQNGYAKEAINMFKEMKEANVRITEVAMVGAISACTQLGDIEIANTLTKILEEGCCGRTTFVSNALIHMHSKCGSIEQARGEFNRMRNRDVISYSTFITALAEHGKAYEALDVFSGMQKEGIKPNQITFVGILNVCSYSGLVEEGCKNFELMNRAFGIEPLPEHYACIVDLLGRAGQLERAYNLVMDNVGASDSRTWGALLGACKIHSNAELGEIATRNLTKMEPGNAGNYVLLANIYASMEDWENAEKVRKMMDERGMRKSPGCSWISRMR